MEHRSENYQSPPGEIDLGTLIATIWEGKWIIATIMAICLGLTAAYLLLTSTAYSTQLEIRPITSFQAEPYDFLNRLEFFNIDRDDLLTLFGERLATREDLIQAVTSYNLIDRSNFESDEQYAEEVREFANAITIEGPGVGGDAGRLSILIGLRGPSQGAAAAAFSDAFTNVSEFVRESLEKRFNSRIATESQMRQLELEDIARQIKDTRANYELEMEQRLAFLGEQAQIARQLNQSTPTPHGQNVTTSGSLSVGIVQEQPYYLFGYEAIEKEIALIKARDNKDAFIPELSKLEKERRELINDPFLDRVQAAFDATPLTSPEKFKAARWDLSSNDFEPDTRAALVLVLAAVLGGMLGLFVLLIKVAVTSTKRKQTTS